MPNSHFNTTLWAFPEELITRLIITTLIEDPNSLASLKLVSKDFNRIINSELVNQTIRSQIHLECPSIFSSEWLEKESTYKINSNLELLQLIRGIQKSLKFELANPESEVHEWMKLINATDNKNDLWKELREIQERKELLDKKYMEQSQHDHTIFYTGGKVNYPPSLDIFVYLMLCSGADIEAIIDSTYSVTPLTYAALCMHDVNTVNLLISAGANIYYKINEHSDSLFFSICGMHNDHVSFDKQKRIMKLFLDAGQDIDALDSSDQTALTSIVTGSTSGDTGSKSVKALIQLGANINRSDPYALSLLYIAISSNLRGSTRYLVSAGADINSYVGLTGKTGISLLLDCSLSGSDRKECGIKQYIELGADVNKVNQDGTYPLDIAIRQGNNSYIDLLVQAGAKNSSCFSLEIVEDTLEYQRSLVENSCETSEDNFSNSMTSYTPMFT